MGETRRKSEGFSYPSRPYPASISRQLRRECVALRRALRLADPLGLRVRTIDDFCLSASRATSCRSRSGAHPDAGQAQAVQSWTFNLSRGNSGAASARKGEHSYPLGSRPCTPALEFRRADTSRAFSGGWNNAQLRMAHVAFVVVRIVLQRNFHRMAAAFKPQLEGLVGHDAAILNP